MTMIKPEVPSDPKAMIAEAEKALADISRIKTGIGTVIFGQESVIERTLVALLAGGHALLVGVPGLAKQSWWKHWGLFSVLTTAAFNSRRTLCLQISWALKSWNRMTMANVIFAMSEALFSLNCSWRTK